MLSEMPVALPCILCAAVSSMPATQPATQPATPPATQCPELFAQQRGTVEPAPRNQVEQGLVAHVDTSIDRANRLQSKITAEVLSIEGMSSPKIRHLLNNLGERPDTRYLEVGVWRGSTFISTLYGNELYITQAFGIDNWSQFRGHKARLDFLQSSQNLLTPNCFTLLEQDCFTVELSTFRKKTNLYFYDGSHSSEAQYKAFSYYDPVLDSPAIVMVDDWQACNVRTATFEAFRALGYQVIHERHLAQADGWWQGFYVAIIRKN